MLTLEEGKCAVKLARSAIENYLKEGKIIEPRADLPRVFSEKRGVFVTLNKNKELRGCIGYPYPSIPLKNAIIDSAISAATRDPRFPSVTKSELKNISLEVTVLTPPELIKCKPKEIPNNIKIGKHGLIVKKGLYQGLLLPQVAVEHGFDEMDFLSHTCMKAGLLPDAWLEGVEVYCFEGQIFEETEEGIKEKEIGVCE